MLIINQLYKKYSKPILIKYFVVISFFLFSDIQAQSNFNTYCNERFGFCLKYPTYLIPQEEASNGDGRSFISNDQTVSLSVWGVNALDQSLAEYCEHAYGKSEQVTYKVIQKDWAVFSGYTTNDKIFYQKIWFKNGWLYTFNLEYPKAKRKNYDALCKKIADSFILPKD